MQFAVSRPEFYMDEGRAEPAFSSARDLEGSAKVCIRPARLLCRLALAPSRGYGSPKGDGIISILVALKAGAAALSLGGGGYGIATKRSAYKAQKRIEMLEAEARAGRLLAQSRCQRLL